jgi:hypothetical protein
MSIKTAKVLTVNKRRLPIDALHEAVRAGEGRALVCQDTFATWFGGPDDLDDNGETASGFSTYFHPEILGCALPIPSRGVCIGSPLPQVPWNMPVQVTRLDTGETITCKLIDRGPGLTNPQRATIDLTPGAFRALGVELDYWKPREGVLPVSWRVSLAATPQPRRLVVPPPPGLFKAA